MTEDAPDHLERLADELEAGAELTSSQRAAVAAALRQALTLPAARNEERDRLIVEARHRFYADRTDHDAAHEIATQWRRYAVTGWLRDRVCDSCPPRIAGNLHGALWAIMQQSPRPLSADRVRKIVGRLK
ncbi:hypothetical protein CQ14_03055 [Bradyrhizobium lablabi]|uniref:Uncharacterized protein n=1 Tax=Bradyrhizobium lablabi TaxID=722472 RepID=A0A0R3N9L9_9BRAD|nr:hypothetical protein [Bradyrhizobium lablabi]KRR26480.1 hypothetical protein CQ14_03055 [Bradyrhizobium lablabi]